MALPFWLGGAADYQLDAKTNKYIVQYVGLSADPANPFDVDADGDPLATRSTSRVLPFYRFPNDRITGTPATYFIFWPATDLPPTIGAGYAYFRAENKSYATKGFPSLGFGAMVDGRHTPMPWLNPDSFQIRSCGRDGLWYSGRTTMDGDCWGHKLGLTEMFLPAFPSVSTADDMGNCWEGTLEDNLL
jgi:hypothetical protein